MDHSAKKSINMIFGANEDDVVRSSANEEMVDLCCLVADGPAVPSHTVGAAGCS